jgi:ubiquinone/menaquinone biosynthesis C-methylase UbiE
MIAPQTIGFCEEMLATAAGRAFDGMAATYDVTFTQSLIGRAQRDSVWRVLCRTFKPGDRILELNCGTGEDALFLASRAMHVTACDASAAMIETASRRMSTEAPQSSITFRHLPTEQIAELRAEIPFDGVLSNFSGLNCMEDLGVTAKVLAELVRPGASLMLCLSTRFCLTEIFYFLLRGEIRKATRRCSGSTMARVGGKMIAVHYPTVRQLRRHFAPHFKLRGCAGIGVAVPPSYLEAWAVRWPRVFKFLCALDRVLAPLPFFRVTGDHVLLHFVREEA